MLKGQHHVRCLGLPLDTEPYMNCYSGTLFSQSGFLHAGNMLSLFCSFWTKWISILFAWFLSIIYLSTRCKILFADALHKSKTSTKVLSVRVSVSIGTSGSLWNNPVGIWVFFSALRIFIMESPASIIQLILACLLLVANYLISMSHSKCAHMLHICVAHAWNIAMSNSTAPRSLSWKASGSRMLELGCFDGQTCKWYVVYIYMYVWISFIHTCVQYIYIYKQLMCIYIYIIYIQYGYIANNMGQ